jgi:hypothetical protein
MHARSWTRRRAVRWAAGLLVCVLGARAVLAAPAQPSQGAPPTSSPPAATARPFTMGQPGADAASWLSFEGAFTEPWVHAGKRDLRQLRVEVREARPSGRAQRYAGFRGVIRVTDGASLATDYPVVNAYLTVGLAIYLARHDQAVLTLMLRPSASMRGDTPAEGTLLYDDGSFAREVKGTWHARPLVRRLR